MYISIDFLISYEGNIMKEKNNNAYHEVLYIHDTLLKLRHIAQTNQYPMLAYFIEMAWVEVSDILRNQFGHIHKN